MTKVCAKTEPCPLLLANDQPHSNDRDAFETRSNIHDVILSPFLHHNSSENIWPARSICGIFLSSFFEPKWSAILAITSVSILLFDNVQPLRVVLESQKPEFLISGILAHL